MKLIKNYIKQVFRFLGLILIYDKLIYLIIKTKHYKQNYIFIKENPTIQLPPDYMMFESFGLNYKEYYFGGIETAKYLIQHLNNYIELKSLSILEWGCGPARIIRHFPELIKFDCRYYATDYNLKSINWCKEKIKNIEFQENKIYPPLNYSNNFFDIIFGISIFTHLSKSNYFKWFSELIRITKPNGLILITTHGRESIINLTQKEKNSFKDGNMVAKSNTKEGHRTFTSYAPEIFMKNLLNKYSLILYYKCGQIKDWGIEQDLWIVQKKF